MAWTAPRTWIVGEVVTAANMNLHVRDNTRYLKGLDGAVVVEDALSATSFALQMEVGYFTNAADQVMAGTGAWADVPVLTTSVTLDAAGSILAWANIGVRDTTFGSPVSFRLDVDGTAGFATREMDDPDPQNMSLIAHKAACAAGARVVKLQMWGDAAAHVATVNPTAILVYSLPSTAIA